MKTLLLCCLLLASWSVVAEDPNYCHGDDQCETGRWNPLETNVLRARGYGRTPQAATRASERAFRRAFPNQTGSCGIFSGPYEMGVNDLGDGTYSSWTICPLRVGSGYSAPARPRCALIFGVISC